MAPHDALTDMDDATYEEKRRAVALLERLTAQARIELVREGNLIRAPVMEASAEGVLISEVLGIFLFLFLLLGMVVFFHKETNCVSEARHRLRSSARRVVRGIRRRVCRFDREWSCEEVSSGSSDTSQTGVYRDISSLDDVIRAETKTPEVMFDHREALLELFADLELHREVVHDSIRDYSAVLSRLNNPGSGQKLKGILRPAGAASVHGKHRHGHHGHGHHGHHGHGHRHRHAADKCVVIAETELNGDGVIRNGDVTAKNGDVAAKNSDVTAKNGDGVPEKMERDVMQRQEQDAGMESGFREVTSSARGSQTKRDASVKTGGYIPVKESGDVTTEANGNPAAEASSEHAASDVSEDTSAEASRAAVTEAGIAGTAAETRQAGAEDAGSAASPEINPDKYPEMDITAETGHGIESRCEVSSQTTRPTNPAPPEISHPAGRNSDPTARIITGIGARAGAEGDREPPREGPLLVKDDAFPQQDAACPDLRPVSGSTGPAAGIQMESDGSVSGGRLQEGEV